MKRVTWNILGRLFTDEVSHQINWKGVNSKKPFSRMATKTLLFSEYIVLNTFKVNSLKMLGQP